MTAQQAYLYDKFKELTQLFPTIKIQYEIKLRNGYTNYIIEITPFEIYENEKYMDFESDMYFEFEEIFPYCEIMFISSESLCQLTNPIKYE